MQNTHSSSAASTLLDLTRPCIVRATEVPIAQGPGESGAFMLTGEQTDNRVTVASAFIDVNGGPPPHIHADAEEIFIIQSGSLELLANGEVVTAHAGDVAYLARGEAHRFRGLDSGETNHVHVIVAPSGFEQFMRRWIPLFENGAPDMGEAVRLCGEHNIALYPSDDLAPPPPANPQTKLIRAGEKPVLSVLGCAVTLFLSAADTEGRYSLSRVEGPRDAGPPLHFHDREDELFIVEEGQIEFTLGEEVVTAEKGDVVWAPRGHAHTFRIVSERARMSNFMTPGGFEEFFTQCHQLELAGGVEPSAIFALGEQVGITFLPPIR